MILAPTFAQTLHQQGLTALQDELTAAGVTNDGLILSGETLWLVDANGARAEIPVAAQPLVLAHVPPAPVDFGTEAVDGADRPALQQAVTNLRQYVGTSSPTAAQTTAALKLTIRLMLALARRAGV